jgi:hypothetical protein
VAWTTGDLINSVKRTASIPSAQSSLGDQDILDIANEQMQAYIVPVITSQREDYFVTSIDLPLVNGDITYRLPTRSVGQALRQVYLVNALGHVVAFPRISREDLEAASRGFYLDGNVLTLVVDDPSQVQQLGTSIRMMYHQRPNTMVLPGSTAVIQSINTGLNQVTLASTPPATFVSGLLYDIGRGRPGFENLAIDSQATVAGSVMTFTALPADLAVGDIVALAGETTFPQVPIEVHPLLALRVAAACLDVLGDSEHVASAAAALTRMEQDVVKLLAPRVAGNIERMVNRGSIFRHFW